MGRATPDPITIRTLLPMKNCGDRIALADLGHLQANMVYASFLRHYYF